MRNLLLVTAFLSILILSACRSSNTNKLPILGSREPVTKEVNGKTVTDTVYHSIPDFEFLNQDSLAITEKTFENSIYVADFFFTSCPSICPIMHRNLLEVYKKYKGNSEVMFLSHSIDTKYDTPSVLKSYAEKLGVTGNEWQFASGTRETIYGISPEYMVFTEENDQVAGGFEHQGWFILVDKDRHIRGAYNGTDEKEVAKLMKDMDILLSEYEK
ncbi:SCO family protein [Albibacterium sp.]|uniref:SCO family protein n=1 Tax=Albibacterium sp. TaxID=2952885 RepID=UPI002CA437D8|nr:SCO family protein [Albibacterium sp.]HUH18585.1 SCO family protein [Albibacterium sp.]